MSKFIVFEGIDGSGKSTLSKNVFQLFVSKNIPTELFREPTNYDTGLRLRDFLKGKIRLNPDEQMKLFISDRRESVKRNIQPALSLGKIVLLDRYYFSTAAYQASEENSAQSILDLNLKENFPRPNKIFFLNINPESAMKRIQLNRNEIDVFENLEKLTSIRNNYLSILPVDTIFLDALKSEEELMRDVLENLEMNSDYESRN
ncbi:MAG: dTMP kinase [Leptospiraceae bacterium]|nr:dTMP kinase [Leptospiraceae bacterium]MCZ8346892.1 dTMP kinase [Leptospiraceae bacterium]